MQFVSWPTFDVRVASLGELFETGLYVNTTQTYWRLKLERGCCKLQLFVMFVYLLCPLLEINIISEYTYLKFYYCFFFFPFLSLGSLEILMGLNDNLKKGFCCRDVCMYNESAPGRRLDEFCFSCYVKYVNVWLSKDKIRYMFG